MEQWRKRKQFMILLTLIWVAQMAAAFYFCTQKQGFHEDEYYTYYSTARTNGFYVEDGIWMDRETYRNEFVVLPEQRFQYGLVKLVQSWDVHPPLYYWVFHTAASLAPGVFTKWSGLIVNLLFHGINIVLLAYLAYLAGGQNGGVSLLAVLFWGVSPAVMSGVVFIRMYEMLTMFVLLCAILHLRAVQKNEKKLSVPGCLAPMAAVTYLGFLTQYYYVVFLFYLGAAFCVWLLRRDRKLRNCVRYGAAQGAALGLAWMTYPACLGQMFRGQRGAQAADNFFDRSNTATRICFFFDLMNRYVFGHLLPVLLLLIAVMAAACLWHGRSAERSAAMGGKCGIAFDVRFRMLAFAAAGYFLTVSKTALLLGDTSNRYQLPIYGIAVFLVFTAAGELWRRSLVICAEKGAHVRYAGYVEKAAGVFCIAAILGAYFWDGVPFLYPEDREQIAFAKECAENGTPAVWLYQPGEEWCVWDVTDELLRYPRIYFASAANSEPPDDETIQSADAVIVYLAHGADAEEQLGRILMCNPRLTGYRLVFDEKYCGVWLVYGIL